MATENVPTPVVAERYPWHEALWSALSRQLEQLPHALLLQGCPGLGKLDFALQLAQALLCDRPQDAHACRSCHACHLFQAGTHPDLARVSPIEDAKSISIDQVRALGDFLSLRPHTSRRKVVILAPAEAMTLNAANSLLKMLEEPPLGSVLLLVTSHPVRLPATIRSRCARLVFRPPSTLAGQNWLQSRPEIRENPGPLLKQAGGAPLLALALAREDFPQTRTQWLQDMVALAASRENPVSCAARWKGMGTARVLAWLHGFVVDLIKLNLGAASSHLQNPEAASLEKAGIKKYKIKELYAFIDVILENYRTLNSPLDEQLILEDVLIRWVRLGRLQ